MMINEREMKKYELVNPKEVNDIILYQVKALRDFAYVKTGDLGGWIEKEDNLSHEDAWVFGNAWVSGDARVSEDARVFGNVLVSGDVKVFENNNIEVNYSRKEINKVLNDISDESYKKFNSSSFSSGFFRSYLLELLEQCDKETQREYMKQMLETLEDFKNK